MPSNTGWTTDRRSRVVLLIRLRPPRGIVAGVREAHAVIDRLTAECQALSWQLYRVSGELAELDRLIGGAPAPPAPAPRPVAPQPAVQPVRHKQPVRTGADPNWIGKLLAVAGVAVTLVGVVLLLVLAAQAGMLGPQLRAAGGIGLAAGLVAVAARLHGRPGGRIGAIALAATGIAAAYLDVMAITTVYAWVPAPVGLVLAAAVAGVGLTLARRWDSQHLGVLVLVPMIGLAPVLTDGVDLLLIGYLLILSAAALPVQLGKDWLAMAAARVATPTVPLLAALVLGGGHDRPALLAGACGVGAALAILSGLLLIPSTTDHARLALLSAAGALPVLAAGIALDRVPATVSAAALAAGLLAVVLIGRALPRVVVATWSALASLATLIAVTTALHGPVQAPVLLTIGVLIAVAGHRDRVAQWAATGFGAIGMLSYLHYAGPDTLLYATAVPTPQAVSTLVGGLLVIALVVAIGRAVKAVLTGQDGAVLAVAAGALIVYAVTAVTVTLGVMAGGTGAGFIAGHTAATICWIALAAGILGYALRLPEEHRRPLILAGLALTGAATAKLFLFDLATLAGMYRVAAFIVVGLILLGMGAKYARSLAVQSAPKGDR